MAKITIYTSEGQRYDGSSRQQNEQIQDYFFDGVRFAMDKSRGTTIACFFRAREPSNRAEQYYAVFEASQRSSSPIADFAKEVPQYVENNLGLEIDTSGGDTAVFEAVLNGWSRNDIPGTDFERATLDTLVKRGQRVQVGVRDSQRALALGGWLVKDRSGQSFAIADNASGDSLSEFDLAVEPGSYRGLQPLAETVELFEAAKQEQEERFISSKVSNIRSEIEDLRTETSLSAHDISDRLKRDLNVLDAPESSSFDGLGSDTSDDSLIPSRGKLIAGGLIAVLLIAGLCILAYVLTTVLGVDVPVISGLVGGGSAAPTIQLASVGGVNASAEPITVDEPNPEFVFNVSDVSSDAELVVNLTSETADSPVSTTQVEDGQARIILDTQQLSAGENDLQVSVSSSGVAKSYTVVYDVEPSISITSGNESAATVRDGTVQIHATNHTLSIEPSGFEGDLELTVSNENATIQQATAQSSASPIEFSVNTSQLDPSARYRFLVSSAEGDASIERTLAYRPPVVTTLSGSQGATVSGNNITVSENASLNITTEYARIDVLIGNDTQRISGGSGKIDIDKQVASDANELVIEVSGIDISETYQLKAENSS